MNNHVRYMLVKIQKLQTINEMILHKDIIESPIFANPDLLKTWIYCLFKASNKKKYISVKVGRGYTEIELQKNQFVFQRSVVSDELNYKNSQTYTLFK